MRKWVGFLLFCLVVTVQPAFAQEVRARGSEAVTMGVNTNSASIGYWHKMSDATSLGGDFTFIYRDHEHSDSQAYQFSPGIKHYLLPELPVSPYLYGAIIGKYGENSSRSENFTSRSENYTAGLQGGIGLEWFPVQRLSIAGHVGVIAQYEKTHSFQGQTTTSRALGDLGSSATTEEGFSVGTISSGFLMNLYF